MSGSPFAPPASELGALQRTLAGEHAAVYVLGALGAQTSRSATPALYAAVDGAYVAHRARRDQLVATIRDLGGDPVAPAVAYELPGALGTVPDPDRVVRRRARQLEADLAATYVWLVGATTGERRAWAVTALTDAAVRGLAFGSAAETLPGMDATPTT